MKTFESCKASGLGKSGQTLKRATQRGWGVSVLRDIQNPSGYNPELL